MAVISVYTMAMPRLACTASSSSASSFPLSPLPRPCSLHSLGEARLGPKFRAQSSGLRLPAVLRLRCWQGVHGTLALLCKLDMAPEKLRAQRQGAAYMVDGL